MQIAIELAKSKEQAARLYHDRCPHEEIIVTELLEAKAEALEQFAPNAAPRGSHGYCPPPYHELLRREVRARRELGL